MYTHFLNYKTTDKSFWLFLLDNTGKLYMHNLISDTARFVQDVAPVMMYVEFHTKHHMAISEFRNLRMLNTLTAYHMC